MDGEPIGGGPEGLANVILDDNGLVLGGYGGSHDLLLGALHHSLSQTAPAPHPLRPEVALS